MRTALSLVEFLQDLNVKSPEDRVILEAKRAEEHKSHLTLTRSIYLRQHRRGHVCVVEHFWGSRAWGATALLPGRRACVDQCQYASTLPDEHGEQKPIRKRMGLHATPEELADRMERTCPGLHRHLHLIGGSPGCPSRSRAAGVYQPGFCQGVANYLVQAYETKGGKRGETKAGAEPKVEGQDRQHGGEKLSRPKKSMRTKLWKSAKRLGALATWSAMAASTLMGDRLLVGEEPGAAVIFKVGGYVKTMEAIDYGYHVCEPLMPEWLGLEEADEMVVSLLQEVRPTTLWLHGANLGVLEDGICDLECGGRVDPVGGRSTRPSPDWAPLTVHAAVRLSTLPSGATSLRK